MWPEPVERIAAFLRASASEGRIEEVLQGSEPPPGLALSAASFECEGRTVVGLVPSSRDLDPEKLAAAANCVALHPAGSTLGFPFQGADVFVENSVAGSQTVWLELSSPQHFLGLAPGQLLRLTQARTADLLAENRIGGG